MICVEGKVAQGSLAARRGGRPTPEQARQITVRILEAAADLFLKQGFEATSIDEIAATACVSKRTFYTRFCSKEDLFAAVIRHRVDLLERSIEGLGDRRDTLQEELTEIGYAFSQITLTPRAVALDRLVSTEARKFPELAFAFYNIAHARGCQLVTEIFEAAKHRHEIEVKDIDFLAEQFIFSVVAGPLRKVILGVESPPSDQDLRTHVVRLVNLFMNGCLNFISSDDGARL